MHSLGTVPGKILADPPVETKRLKECQWEPWVKHMIPDDWRSGVYLGQLTTERECSKLCPLYRQGRQKSRSVVSMLGQHLECLQPLA